MPGWLLVLGGFGLFVSAERIEWNTQIPKYLVHCGRNRLIDSARHQCAVRIRARTFNWILLRNERWHAATTTPPAYRRSIVPIANGGGRRGEGGGGGGCCAKCMPISPIPARHHSNVATQALTRIAMIRQTIQTLTSALR